MPLTFSPPLLAPEIQLLTKFSGAPGTGLPWQPGDISENSAATANGVAAYVYNGSSAWEGIPLGNASGTLNPLQAGVATGSGTYTGGPSDMFTVTGATASSHCTFSPTNSTAAAATVVGYITIVAANMVTIAHATITAAGGTVNIICTAN
jgi:hypothetical protein